MSALPISKPRFKSIIFFIKIALKLSHFSNKMQNFRALGLRPQTPVPPAAGSFASKLLSSGGWGLRPQTPKSAPPLRISGYAPASVICLSDTSLLPTSLDSDFLTFDSSPLFSKILVTCQTGPRLLIFHSTISLSIKSFSSENF